jgi:hypothetical protein
MADTKTQERQGVTRPGLKPFVRPAAAESPALQPMAPAFGRVTLPPFGPIRYGGPKPGAAVITQTREDDEAPTWASIEEYAHATPSVPEVPDLEESAPEPEPEPVVAHEPEIAPEPETMVVPEPEPEPMVAEAVTEEPPAWLDAVPKDGPSEPMPWEAAPEPEPEYEAEPEPVMRRPVLPLTGPTDPTPIMNQTIERTTEPHRMTPMRVTPLRSASISPTPTYSTAEPNARAVAAALEMVAGRIRRGELVVSGSMPSNDDPPALAAVLAATAAALLGVKA